jgi:hypothetical protein
MNEIRYGPLYGDVIFDEILLPLAYGMNFLWSDDSKILALQQWLSTSEGQGPLTRIALIDTPNMRMSFFKSFRGFAEPRSIENGRLIYQKKVFATGHESREEYEVDIESISNWMDIPKVPFDFKAAVNFILTPYMETIGFITQGVVFSGDGYQIEFRGDDVNLVYSDFGRLDPASLMLKKGDSGWLDYKSQIARYANRQMPELSDYLATVQIIEATFLQILGSMKFSERLPELQKINSGAEEVLARTVYTYPEWQISIMANEDQSRFFIGFPVSVGPYKIDVMTYQELNSHEIKSWQTGTLDIQAEGKRRAEQAMRARSYEYEASKRQIMAEKKTTASPINLRLLRFKTMLLRILFRK